MKSRLQRLKTSLRRFSLDAIIVSNPSNIFYLSGFRGHDSYCLITPSSSFIITDFRYAQEAMRDAIGFDIIIGGGSLISKTAKLIKARSIRRVGFESAYMSFREAEYLARAISKKLIPVSGLLEKQRIVKDESEIASIIRAAKIAKNALKKTVKEIKKGEIENIIAARLDFFLKTQGAESSAFDTIVASGPNSSMPHARASRSRIPQSQPIIIDCGARFAGYNSDLTRTHFVGKIYERFKLIYNIVASAQAKAIDAVRPSRKISDIDKAARDYICKKGFDRYFGHATGHGIGIDVHEGPAISSKNHALAREGMVFTIEPGIYIPGSGGVRIEDMVLVTKTAYR